MATHLSPLLTFWLKPAASTRTLLASGSGHIWALLIAVGFGAVQSGSVYLRSESPSPFIFVWGALAGGIGLYLFGLFFRVVGRLFKGDPKPREVRTALGLSLLPWTLLFGWLFWLTQNGQDATVIAKYYPLFFILFLYGYTVLLLSLSVALGLSLWRTFFCIVLTCLGSLFPLTLIAQLIFGASGLGV